MAPQTHESPHTKGDIDGLKREREREICAAIPFLSFLLPSLPSLFLPSCLQSGQISLALIRFEHWACCWCAVHTPHRGWQMISQPLWAARQKTEHSYWKSTSAPWSLVLGETPECCGSVTRWEKFECTNQAWKHIILEIICNFTLKG